MNIIIPMSGLGSRFLKEGFRKPKPLIKVISKTLIQHTIESLNIYGKIIFITRDFGKIYNEELTCHLKSIAPGSVEIKIKNPTRGSVETSLYAKDLINNDEELIITNCDQILEWNAANFLDASRSANACGSILTYSSNNSKNSFASIDKQNNVIKIVEKKVISNHALVGLHYWKSGLDFVNSAEKLLKDFESQGKPECYISETYNYLIKEGKNIIALPVSPGNYISLGTPYDISVYAGKIGEFKTPKPKTIFCDIDGTIINHAHKFSDLIKNEQKPLPGVLKKINEWDSKGHKIILCTARKESARSMTEKYLISLGFCWDQLIMGVTSGVRVLINDNISLDESRRSVSVNVKTDEGFENIKWGDVGL